MLDAGLRLAESTSLTWLDLWPGTAPANYVTIKCRNSKTSTSREIPLTAALRASIAQTYSSIMADRFGLPGLSAAAPSYGHPARSHRWIQRHLAYLGNRILNRHITPHMLRHTFATRLLRVSDLETVRVALGHARLNTTQIYVHKTTQELSDAIHRVPTACSTA